MPTHSNTLAGEISWTEEPGGLQSTGSQSLPSTQVLEQVWAYFTYSQLLPEKPQTLQIRMHAHSGLDRPLHQFPGSRGDQGTWNVSGT